LQKRAHVLQHVKGAILKGLESGTDHSN